MIDEHPAHVLRQYREALLDGHSPTLIRYVAARRVAERAPALRQTGRTTGAIEFRHQLDALMVVSSERDRRRMADRGVPAPAIVTAREVLNRRGHRPGKFVLDHLVWSSMSVVDLCRLASAMAVAGDAVVLQLSRVFEMGRLARSHRPRRATRAA